ncbi:MAG: SPOR domain-containing protein [Proteobacteria bacterium]|nr:SPOR domain-containing protein [Pseudomonadota bacterium]
MSDTLLVEEGGIGEVVVELLGEGEFQRRLTNNRGEFRFPDLAPGEFVLRLDTETIPSSYRISPDSMIVVVAPSEEHTVGFSVIERKRVVRVIQQGEVRVDAAPRVPVGIESEQFQSECLLLPAPGGSGFKVQVSSWQTQAKAQAVALWASSVSGYSSSVETITLGGGLTRYAVRLSKVSDQDEAQRLCELLAELDRNRQSPLPGVALPKPPVSVQQEKADTTQVRPAIRFLSPERVKELLKKSGEKKK